MPGVGLAPGSPVAAEDIRNLKRGTRHGPRRLSLGLVLLLFDQAEPVQAGSSLCGSCWWPRGIKRRRVELGVTERPRVIMLTFYVIEIEGSVEPD